jgi:hypothetical protein
MTLKNVSPALPLEYLIVTLPLGKPITTDLTLDNADRSVAWQLHRTLLHGVRSQDTVDGFTSFNDLVESVRATGVKIADYSKVSIEMQFDNQHLSPVSLSDLIKVVGKEQAINAIMTGWVDPRKIVSLGKAKKSDSPKEKSRPSMFDLGSKKSPAKKVAKTPAIETATPNLTPDAV